ncbi:Uncharacterised protein [Mycobacteroides abscessus subsp. abscessus]|nr:Uncharacterised protein [Mycobacteroides abscessus subsp. abscessus]
MVAGYSSEKSTVTVQPWAAAMPCASSSTMLPNRCVPARSMVRTDPPMKASSPITFSAALPARSCVMVATTGSVAGKVCWIFAGRAAAISTAAGTGLRALCGCEPCPPAPCTVMPRMLAAAM